jgi:hypothetical protein
MDIIGKICKYNHTRGFALPKGESYRKRIQAVNAIYDEHVKDGVSNRFIWRMYIHPLFGISERTFYNYLKRATF